MSIIAHGTFNGQSMSTAEEAAFNRAIFGDMFLCLGDEPSITINKTSVGLSPFRVLIYGYEVEFDTPISFSPPYDGIYNRAVVKLTLTRESSKVVTATTSVEGVDDSYQFLNYQVVNFDTSYKVTVDLLELKLGSSSTIIGVRTGWQKLISRQEMLSQLIDMQNKIRDVYRCAGTMKFIADRVDPAAQGWVGNWVKAGRMGFGHINDPTMVIDIYGGARKMENGMNLNLWKCEYAAEQSWVFQDNVNFMPDLIWCCFRYD